MLVHQWAESYRGDPRDYEVAKLALSGVEFLDCSNVPSTLFEGDVDTSAVRPPFPSVVVQGMHQGHPILVFVHAAGVDSYAVFTAIRYADETWVTGPVMRWGKNGTGEWAAFQNQRQPAVGVFQNRQVIFGPEHTEVTACNVAAAWNIFAVMACSNVRTRDHQPDAALNKKRAKAGKVPLVSYKTLEIVVPNTRYEGGGSGGGTHASPRVHLRRGHIRKIADGKTVWVQACVVVSKHGMVLKDYKLRSAP